MYVHLLGTTIQGTPGSLGEPGPACSCVAALALHEWPMNVSQLGRSFINTAAFPHGKYLRPHPTREAVPPRSGWALWNCPTAASTPINTARDHLLKPGWLAFLCPAVFLQH